MLRTTFLTAVAAAGVLSLGFAAPASSATMVLDADNLDCDLFSAEGCLFTHDNDGNVFDDADLIEQAYNSAHVEGPDPETIDLTFIDKVNGVGDSPTLNIDVPFLVSFYAIKSGSSQIQLFGVIDGPKSMFTAENTGILNGSGVPRGISHVSLFSGTFTCTDLQDPLCGGGNTSVPEPATWALMILGFGGAGAMLRRRRDALA